MHASGLLLVAQDNKLLTGLLARTRDMCNMSWVCVGPDAKYDALHTPAARKALAIAASVTSTDNIVIATPAPIANTAYLAAFPAC